MIFDADILISPYYDYSIFDYIVNKKDLENNQKSFKKHSAL